MPKFSKASKEHLNRLHSDLQKILVEVIKVFDFKIICSFRGRDEQMTAYRKGTSKLQWPNSKHNKLPSMAADIVPYPISWKNTSRFLMLMGAVKMTAHNLGIKIRLGGDWNSNNDPSDDSFSDLCHVELV